MKKTAMAMASSIVAHGTVRIREAGVGYRHTFRNTFESNSSTFESYSRATRSSRSVLLPIHLGRGIILMTVSAPTSPAAHEASEVRKSDPAQSAPTSAAAGFSVSGGGSFGLPKAQLDSDTVSISSAAQAASRETNQFSASQAQSALPFTALPFTSR
jgi:hypothetical protein